MSPPHEAIPSPPPPNSRVETRAALVGALGWVCHRGGGLKRKREKSVLRSIARHLLRSIARHLRACLGRLRR